MKLNKNYLDDLLNVGVNKLIGYLPLSTIENCGSNFKELEIFLTDKGLKTWVLPAEKCSVSSGALYVADLQKLQKFLELPMQKTILEKTKIKIDACSFVEMIFSKVIYREKNPELYEIIALCFKDPRPEYSHRIAIDELLINNQNLTKTSKLKL